MLPLTHFHILKWVAGCEVHRAVKFIIAVLLEKYSVM